MEPSSKKNAVKLAQSSNHQNRYYDVGRLDLVFYEFQCFFNNFLSMMSVLELQNVKFKAVQILLYHQYSQFNPTPLLRGQLN